MYQSPSAFLWRIEPKITECSKQAAHACRVHEMVCCKFKRNGDHSLGILHAVYPISNLSIFFDKSLGFSQLCELICCL